LAGMPSLPPKKPHGRWRWPSPSTEAPPSLRNVNSRTEPGPPRHLPAPAMSSRSRSAARARAGGSRYPRSGCCGCWRRACRRRPCRPCQPAAIGSLEDLHVHPVGLVLQAEKAITFRLPMPAETLPGHSVLPLSCFLCQLAPLPCSDQHQNAGIVLRIPPNSSVSIWRRYWGPYWGLPIKHLRNSIKQGEYRRIWRASRNKTANIYVFEIPP
jgi:hypothetical protein